MKIKSDKGKNIEIGRAMKMKIKRERETSILLFGDRNRPLFPIEKSFPPSTKKLFQHFAESCGSSDRRGRPSHEECSHSKGEDREDESLYLSHIRLRWLTISSLSSLISRLRSLFPFSPHRQVVAFLVFVIHHCRQVGTCATKRHHASKQHHTTTTTL